jgi:hypothetical protein
VLIWELLLELLIYLFRVILAPPEISLGGASSKSSVPALQRLAWQSSTPTELSRAVEQASSAPTGSTPCGGKRPRGFRMGAGRNRRMGAGVLGQQELGPWWRFGLPTPKLGAPVGILLELRFLSEHPYLALRAQVGALLELL